MNIKPDNRNYRKHPDKNKLSINESLKKYGAGRSILIDNDEYIIAGNGVFEQAKNLDIPIKIIETNGTELIAIKRTDLNKNSKARKELAVLDNKTSDLSEFDFELLQDDFSFDELNDFGFENVELGLNDNENISSKELENMYEVVVVCNGEREQEKIYNELVKQGYKCRLLTL